MESHTKLSQSVSKALKSQEAKAFYSELRAEGYSLLISKKQYASIARCSISTVDNKIKLGYGLPNYKKMGSAKNSTILFNLIDIANYFTDKSTQTI